MDIKMLVATLPEGEGLAGWCRRLGISRQTAYKWRRRYAGEGRAGLEDRSRAPKRPGGRSSPEVEESVVAMRKRLADTGLDAGAGSIRWHLQQAGRRVPSEATIWRILVRRGQLDRQPNKRPTGACRRFQRLRPNECWQGDDTHYLLAGGQEVRIINLLDDHSRLNVDSLAVANCTSVRVWECFCRGADRCGLPAEFLNDNGRAYISGPEEDPVVFQGHLAAIGVRQLHSRVYHPQTCGKVERFHQTQRRWLQAQVPARTVAELQSQLDCFRVIYNTGRPHRAIGRRTPAAVWSAQPPAAPAAPWAAQTRLRAGRVDGSGVIWVGRHLSIGLGAEWAYCHVTVIRRGEHATVIATTTAEIIRELTIDSSRHYQPSGRRRGGPRRARRRV